MPQSMQLGDAKAAEIKAVSIGKTFGAFHALKNLSLDIGRGEFLDPSWTIRFRQDDFSR